MINDFSAGRMLICGDMPDEITVGGVLYRINSDMRTVLRVIHYIEEGMDIEDAAGIFWAEVPADRKKAAEIMTAFIGEEYIPQKDTKSAFSFYRDAAFIIGGFMECYGIDITADNMHWFRFRALFSALDGSCAFSRLIVCRTAKYSAAEEKLAARRIRMKYGG